MAIQITASAARAVEMLQGIATTLKNLIKVGAGGVYDSILRLFSPGQVKRASSIPSWSLEIKDNPWRSSAQQNLSADGKLLKKAEEGALPSALARPSSPQPDTSVSRPVKEWQLSVPEDAFIDKQTGETDVRKMLFSKRFAQALSVFDATEEIRQNSQACFDEINRLLKNHRLADTVGSNNKSLAAELNQLSLPRDADFDQMKKMQGDGRTASQQTILARFAERIRQLSDKSTAILEHARQVQVSQAIQTAQAVQPRADRVAANKKTENFQEAYRNHFSKALRPFSATPDSEVDKAKKQVMNSLDQFLQKFDAGKLSKKAQKQIHNALDDELDRLAEARTQKKPAQLETLGEFNQQLKNLEARFYGG